MLVLMRSGHRSDACDLSAFSVNPFELLGKLVERNVEDPVANLSGLSLEERIKQVLADLSPREAKVLRMRFGIGGGDTHSLEDIGRVFNLTRERIRQIEIKALGKLRRRQQSYDLFAFV